MAQVGSMPVELWSQVLVSLPKVAQRECAFVCRSWRRVCRRALFTVIRLSAAAGTETDHTDTEAMEEAAKAWEILDCIGNDPTFAPVVKTIIVLKWRFGPSIFETRSLQKALQAVPHLRSFQWLAWADMPLEVLETLHDDIPHLPELRLADPNALQNCELRQLRSIVCLVPREFIDEDEPEVAQCASIDLIAANVDTLRELALDGMLSLPWNLPIRTFENMDHLTLVGLKDLRGLELVLRHSPNLESLIIEYKKDDELFAILAQNPSTVPLLSSFKIISGPTHDESHYMALGTFLQGHPRLRRLDIQMWAPIQSAYIILPTVNVLTDLTAFGLSVSCLPNSIGWVDYSCLPLFLSDAMEAVRFEVNLEEAVLDRGPLLPLMGRLAELPSLRYLSLQHHGDGELWPLAAEVGSTLKHLNCLSLDTSLWFIERASSLDELTAAWLPNKRILRLKEDFMYQDAEWLARFVV